MGEFFRGWRRKIGVVTLVMACVFMGGWVRSTIIGDFICIPFGNYISEEIGSVDETISWSHYSTAFPISWRTGDTKRPWDGGGRINDLSGICLTDSPKLGVGWGTAEVLSGQTMKPVKVTFILVPYWFITIPLTLLSLWLLLVKPGPSKQKKIVEPISTGGK